MFERRRFFLGVTTATAVAIAVGAIAFVHGGSVWGGVAVLAVGAGAFLGHRITVPIVQRLAESEARASAVLKTAVDAIITIDEGGIIKSFNAAAERIFGYAAGEVVGKNVRILMPSPYAEEHDSYLRNYLETGERKIIGVGREVTGLRKDGSTFPIELAVSEVSTDRRRLFTGFVRDISERKAAEAAIHEREERYRSVVETVGVVLLCLSPDYRVMEWNTEAERVYGTPRDAALGKNYIETFLPESARAGVIEEIRKVLSGTPTRGYENPVRSRTGRERVLLWNSTRLPLVDGKPVGIIACGQDITDYKKLLSEMQRKESLSRLGEMAAVVAHEIKNPLAAISAAIQVVGNQLPPASPHAEVVSEILGRIDALSHTVDDLLFFARPHAPSLKPLPIRSLLEDTIRLFSQDPRFEKAEVEVGGEEVFVEGDAALLKPVFLNLLVNAAQAADGAGKISVNISNSSGSCRVDVVDAGPGISPEVRERIFEPFFTTKARGSGLGLPTAKRVVDSHRGELTVDCPPEGGTCVTVRLRLAAREARGKA